MFSKTKSLFFAAFAFALISLFPSQADAYQTPLYRYWHQGAGQHFLTTNWNELGSGKDGWQYIGIQAKIETQQLANLVPFYRFYNTRNGSHMYTINASEAPSSAGWQYIGVMGYVGTKSDSCGCGPNLLPLYRAIYPGNGTLFYTTDWNEMLNAVNNLGYNYQGPTAWVYSK